MGNSRETSSTLDLQSRIARRVVLILCPTVFVAALAAVIAVQFAAPDQPQRMAGAITALILSSPALILGFLRKWKAAAGSLVAMLGFTIFVSMWNSGGPFAPGYWMSLSLIAVIGWLYGTRAAIGTGFFVVMLGICMGLLVQQGMLRPPPPLNLGLVLTSIVIFGSVFIVAAVVPASMAKTAFAESEFARAALIEAAQREEEMRAAFDAVFDQTFEFAGILDPFGTVLRANSTALRFIGAKEEDVLGKFFWETPWWPESEVPALRDAIRLAREGEPSRFKTHYIDFTGKKRVVDFSLTPFKRAGQVVYLIPEGRDITDLVEAEERLTHTQKIDAIGQLAGGVAHDFNNLLTGIMGAADLLSSRLESLDAAEDAKLMVDLILNASHRAADLTAQLLTFSRKNPADRRTLKINDCLKSVHALLERTIDPSIELVLDLAPSNPVILADAALIENAILNLAINGRDAMKAGGVLTMQTHVVALGEEAARATGFDIKPGECVRITIQDTGSGISEDIRQRIFEPFFTTKEEGTGLGLPSVFGTVVRHGGAILVYSEEGQGSQFQIYFPSAQESDSPEQLTPAEEERFAGLRVLLAEDDATSRASTELQLKHLQCIVKSAHDGFAALDIFHQAPEEYDMAMLDVIMPGIRGPSVARAILEIRPDLPIILMSGFPGDEDLSVLSECRGTLLRKPFARNALADTIARTLHQQTPLGPEA